MFYAMMMTHTPNPNTMLTTAEPVVIPVPADTTPESFAEHLDTVHWHLGAVIVDQTGTVVLRADGNVSVDFL
jgi:hypothetical protein